MPLQLPSTRQRNHTHAQPERHPKKKDFEVQKRSRNLVVVAKYSNDAAQKRSNQKHTVAPVAAAVGPTYDLGAQLTTGWNQLYDGFSERGKPENPEKTLEAE